MAKQEQRVLSIVELAAVTAVNQEYQRAVQEVEAANKVFAAANGKRLAVMMELGLDPNKVWKISPEGVVEEITNAGHRQRAAGAVAPAQNGRNVGLPSAGSGGV